MNDFENAFERGAADRASNDPTHPRMWIRSREPGIRWNTEKSEAKMEYSGIRYVFHIRHLSSNWYEISYLIICKKVPFTVTLDSCEVICHPPLYVCMYVCMYVSTCPYLVCQVYGPRAGGHARYKCWPYRFQCNFKIKIRNEWHQPVSSMEYGIRNTGPSRACLEYVEYVFTF